jgi:hypothetical protein
MRPLWSRTLSPGLCGLLPARERGWLLAWDAAGALTVLDAAGADVVAARLPQPPTALACAEDGSAVAALAGPSLHFLGPDLAVRWDRRLPGGTAVAVEGLGQYVAAADQAGALLVLDRRGHPVGSATTPRPLRFLAFAAERPLLLGAADFGLVAGFDLRGRCLWRDGLVAHVGSLAVAGAGHAALACFSDGLVRYSPDGVRQAAGPALFVRRAALSYDGGLVLGLGQGREVRLRGRPGTTLAEWEADAEPVGLALDALGRRAALAVADGHVQCLDTGRPAGEVGR